MPDNKKLTLSLKIRRFHGIPIHERLNLSEAEIFELKKSYRDALPKIWVEATKKGFLAEDKFQEAWSDPNTFPNWIASVRKATQHEDHFEKTDAVITDIEGKIIRIQIKSCKKLQQELVIKFFKKGIVIMTINPNDKLKAVRNKTLEAIKRFNLWQAKQA